MISFKLSNDIVFLAFQMQVSVMLLLLNSYCLVNTIQYREYKRNRIVFHKAKTRWQNCAGS